MDSIGNIVNLALEPRKKIEELTPAERQDFYLDCEKYDAEVKSAKAELFKLTSLMPSPGTEQDPETRAALFWDILKTELSPLNIASVCRSAMRGDVGEGTFLPPPARLISYARERFQGREPLRRDPRIAGPGAEPAQRHYSAPEHKLLGNDYREQDLRQDERKRLADKLKREIHAEAALLRDLDKWTEQRAPNLIVSRGELALMDAGEREKHKIEAEDHLGKLKMMPLPKLSPEALALCRIRDAAE